MRSGFVSIFAAMLLAGGSAAAPSEGNSFAIRNVRLFDGVRTVERANVVVRNGLIFAAGQRARIPAGLQVVDGRGRTLLPGMIDSHVHVFPGAQTDALRFGVTADLDMFSLKPDFPRWRAQRDSLRPVSEADTWSAGIGLSAPGGHPSATMPGSGNVPTVASTAEAPAFVAARVAEGSDYVKLIFEDNSFLTPGRPIPALSAKTVCAGIAAAHRAGRKAIVHAGRLRDARIALDCGADGLAHLVADAPVDSEFVRSARTRGLFVTTTLAVVAAGSGFDLGSGLYDRADVAPFLSPGQKYILKAGFGPVRPRGIETALRSARILHRAGVTLLAGTDAPNPGAPHGIGLQAELRLLVRAGLTPVEALAAATSVPARVFSLRGRGCVRTGCRADLLLVRGNPTRRIDDLAAIERIWKNGFPVSRALPAAPVPK